MKKLSIVSTLLAIFVCANVSAEDILITNARLIDGSGAEPQEGVSILVRDGWITAIGDNASAESIRVLDVDGATVLPGLIDAHVHFFWGPGSFQYDLELVDENGNFDIEQWRQTIGRNVRHYLRAYLACGVTTTLDAGGPGEVATEVYNYLAAGDPGPRFLPLGPFMAAPGGYADSGWIKPITSSADVEKHFDELEALGTVGAKVMIERGWNSQEELPVHSPEIRQTIAQASAERNVPLYIHATSEPDMLLALEMEPRVLMHPLLSRDAKLSDDFIQHMAQTDTYQVTTLIPADAELTFYHPERLDNSFLDVVVPEDELNAARDPHMRREAKKAFVRSVIPGLPEFLVPVFVVMHYFFEQQYTDWLEISLDAIGRLHAGGINIVAGSDAAYAAWALYAFHGPSTLREIELLGQAGLTNMEALEAATRVAAEMLGIDDEIGTVEVGKRADLVILQDDPLEDLSALWSIQYTVQDGVAKTPQEWME